MNASGEHLNDHGAARLKKAPVIRAASPRPAGSPPHHTAAYIAQMCAEMVEMAQSADLAFLAHLLSMAQVEADVAGDYVT